MAAPEISMNQLQNSQGDILQFLGDPATHSGRQVRRIETHANVVFLAGDRALKVKRAVRFPFLDYSMLAKRKAACAAELEVNRAFAPELYRRIVPVTRDADGKLALDGDGETVEWAVEMQRFDESRTLDRIADSSGIEGGLAAKLAAMVSSMHSKSPPAEPASWIAAFEGFLEQNATAFREAPELFATDAAEQLDQAARAAFHCMQPLLVSRGGRGLIRRCHGDLHLGNIALLDGRPVPFDAIEFDPEVAAGDVLYDLAFLLMDLLDRGFRSAANIVLNGYFDHVPKAEDLDGLAALPLFMSTRAAIRAKVIAARLRYTEAKDRTAAIERAKTYFRLAIDLLAPASPKLVAVGGLSGTGKSTLARALAPFIVPEPGALCFRSDVERKKLFGVAETEHLPQDAYRAAVGAKIYALLTDKAVRVVGARHSAVVDAVFAKSEERAAIAAAAASAGIAFRGLFLVADLQTRLARVGTRGPDASDANAAIAREQEEYTLGRIEWIEIDASGTPAETLALARTAIR